jgi:hypothetical protein
MTISFASKVDWVGKTFVFSSCDFVDLPCVQKNMNDPQNHTNQHEQKYFRLTLDVTLNQIA